MKADIQDGGRDQAPCRSSHDPAWRDADRRFRHYGGAFAVLRIGLNLQARSRDAAETAPPLLLLPERIQADDRRRPAGSSVLGSASSFLGLPLVIEVDSLRPLPFSGAERMPPSGFGGSIGATADGALLPLYRRSRRSCRLLHLELEAELDGRVEETRRSRRTARAAARGRPEGQPHLERMLGDAQIPELCWSTIVISSGYCSRRRFEILTPGAPVLNET